ncbi:MAG: hypothetical protein M1416_02080 [Candidatus Pacearchaeota archaeon]|nr:hypothetical protein [Candidatus Pacearchaeota archaeon]
MEKIYDTCEGRNGPVFMKDGKVVLEGDLENSMRKSFSEENNKKIYSEKGVLVHMSKKEYENPDDENYIKIPISEYHRLLSRTPN